MVVSSIRIQTLALSRKVLILNPVSLKRMNLFKKKKKKKRVFLRIIKTKSQKNPNIPTQMMIRMYQRENL
jgi:hypothetical protein